MSPHADNETHLYMLHVMAPGNAPTMTRMVKLSNGHFRVAGPADPNPADPFRGLPRPRTMRLDRPRKRSRKYGPLLNDGREDTRWDLI